MKKKGIILTTVVLLSMTGLTQAQDELHVTLDATWVSKYLWRGFDLLDDKAAFQPSIDVDLYGTGLSLKLWTSQPGSSKDGGSISTVNAEEWDYILTYANRAFDGEMYETSYAISYIYYNFPDNPPEDKDRQEYNLAFAWPNIIPGGIVPSYQFIQLWPSEGGGAARDLAGFIHVFGLAYDYTVPGFLPNNPEQTFRLSWGITYNDGAGGDEVDHDWSHMLWGVSTPIECGPGNFTPALYYQTSMDDSVNSEDELWVGLSYNVTF